MAKYDPDKLEAEANSAPTGGEYDGKITEIDEVTAEDVYGNEAASNPDKPMIQVYVTAESGAEFTEAFALPAGQLSWQNPNFKLGRYRTKYGGLPREGDSVKVSVNDEGFLAIVLAEK